MKISKNKARSATTPKRPKARPGLGTRTQSRADVRGVQAELPFKKGWGGTREGAGRKLEGRRRKWVRRVTRERLASRFPVHVTLRLRRGLPSLRRKAVYRVLRACFELGCERFGFRMTHYSVQGNHLHLICEAKDRRALSRGIQGLTVRIARALNRLWERSGSVFGDRYHDRILRSPREVRNAIVYVLHNARHHGARYEGPDYWASGWWFDGWRGLRSGRVRLHVPEGVHCPVAQSKTWLLSVGWRKHGLIDLEESPKPG